MKQLITTLIMVGPLLTLGSRVHAKYGGGTGDPCDPYLIYDPNHLNQISLDPCDWDKCFRVMADIDLDPCLPGGQIYTTALIAPDTDNSNSDFEGTRFTGVFDGTGHPSTVPGSRTRGSSVSSSILTIPIASTSAPPATACSSGACRIHEKHNE